MNVQVSYNTSGIPTNVRVAKNGEDVAFFDIKNAEATLTAVEPHDGADIVYGERIQEIFDRVEVVPGIKSVGLPSLEDGDA